MRATGVWEPIGFRSVFPFLFGGTFIEGFGVLTNEQAGVISLPFRRDFH